MPDERTSSTLAVAQLVEAVGHRRPPTIDQHASLRDAVEALEQQRHTRILYVTDHDDALVGVLTAGALLRHVESHGHVPRLHARRIPSLLGGETVEDLMIHHPVALQLDDTVDQALRKMTETGAKELPVVDDAGRVVGDVTVVDALYHVLVPDPSTRSPD